MIAVLGRPGIARAMAEQWAGARGWRCRINNDLISRSALLELTHNHIDGTVDCNDIARFPAVDAEPVTHSMWLEHLGAQNTRCWTCLNCDTMGSPRWKRCPVCKAKMDMEVE